MATDWTADTNTKLACKFEETSGSVIDSSTIGNNGTITNSTGVTQGATGKYSNGLAFTAGNNAKLTFPAGASNNNLANISICVWLKNTTYGNSSSSSDRAQIIGKGYRSGVLGFQTTNQLRWTEHYGGGNVQYTTTSGSMVTGSFQHVAFTYGNRSGSSPSPTAKFYADGVLLSSSASGSPFLTRDDDSGEPITVGQDTIDLGEINSTYDELLLYSGILTSTDINEIKDNGIDGTQGATTFTETLTINIVSVMDALTVEQRLCNDTIVATVTCVDAKVYPAEALDFTIVSSDSLTDLKVYPAEALDFTIVSSDSLFEIYSQLEINDLTAVILIDAVEVFVPVPTSTYTEELFDTIISSMDEISIQVYLLEEGLITAIITIDEVEVFTGVGGNVFTEELFDTIIGTVALAREVQNYLDLLDISAVVDCLNITGGRMICSDTFTAGVDILVIDNVFPSLTIVSVMSTIESEYTTEDVAFTIVGLTSLSKETQNPQIETALINLIIDLAVNEFQALNSTILEIVIASGMSMGQETYTGFEEVAQGSTSWAEQSASNVTWTEQNPSNQNWTERRI